MNFIDHAVLSMQIHSWHFQGVSYEIDKNADPLKILKDDSNSGVGKYTRQLIRNIYSVIEAAFLSGIAVTIIFILIKLMISKEGKGRSEGKADFTFKILLVIVFFALIPIMNTLLSAVKYIIK